MTDKKVTGFDKATGDEDGIIDVDSQEASQAPRAVFTREASVDASKLQVAQLRVAQGTSAEVADRKASTGDLLVTNFKPMPSVVMIPLGSANIRAYRTDPKKPPVCHSPNGRIGFGNPGGICVDEEGHAVCPFAKWGEKNPVTGKSTPPPCADGITIRGYSVQHRCMVDLQFVKADRRTGSFIEQQAMALGWCGFGIKITTESRKNEKGNWSVPVVEMLETDTELISEKDMETAQKWFDIFQKIQFDTNAEAIASLQSGL